MKTLEFVLSPSTFTYSHIGIIKNTYEINQGILYPDTQTGTFFEIDHNVVTSSIGNNKRPRFGLFEISIRKQGTHYDVHVYTFLDASGTIGGIFQLIVVFTSIFISLLRENVYTYSLLNEIRHKNQSVDVQIEDEKNNANTHSEIQHRSRRNHDTLTVDNQSKSKNQAENMKQNTELSLLASRYLHLYKI